MPSNFRTGHARVLLAVALLCAVALGASRPVLAVPPEPLPLFAATAEGGQPLVPDAAYTAARFVRLNLAALGTAHQPRQAVLLNLPGEPALKATLDQVQALPPGGLAWIGHVDDAPFSTVQLVIRAGIVAGNIGLLDRQYALRFAGADRYLLQQVDQAAFPPEGQPQAVAVPDGDRSAARPAAELGPMDDGSQIDVLVVHTPAARDEVGGTAAMLSVIDLAVAEANAALTLSGVTPRLRLVHAAEVDYAETGDFSLDLGHLQGKQDGFMDQVHGLRDAYGADLVSLIVRQGALCGIGYLMAPAWAGFADWAFSVVAQNCATGYYSFAHELGHNLGSQHDRANASIPGAYSYSYGYRDPVGQFRTIMAYNCPTGCVRLPYFSNPAVSYLGQAVGVDDLAANAANNAHSLNNTAPIAANFRPSLPQIAATATATRASTPTRTATHAPSQTPIGVGTPAAVPQGTGTPADHYFASIYLPFVRGSAP